MKKICTLLMIYCFISTTGSAQVCKILGCADNYGVQTADGTLPNDVSGVLGGCYGATTPFKQVYWQFFFSPTGGEYKQVFTPIGNNRLDLDYIIYDLGLINPSGTIHCPYDPAAEDGDQIICNNDASYDIPTGPGQPAPYGNVFMTTAMHYYAVAVVFYQSGSAPYSFTVGTPTLNTGSGDLPLATSNCNITGLPANLLSFEAKVNNCLVDIDWTTSAESDLKGYEIQYNNGGEGYATITTVAPNGTGQKYHFQHIPSSSGDLSYRLKIINNDKTIEYSKEVFVRFDCNRPRVDVYPNPVTDKLNVHAEYLNDSQTSTSLYDSRGRLLYSGKLINGVNTIDVAKFSKGVYILTVKNRIEIQNFKIVK